MSVQSLSYGILSNESLKLTILNSNNETEEKSFDLEEDRDIFSLIGPHRPNFLLYKDDLNEDLKTSLVNIVPMEEFSESILKSTKDFNEFKNYTDKNFNNWCLVNNLFYVENLVSFSHQLTILWKTDRKKFSLELWKFFRANLGASNLSLLFNYVDEKEKLSLAKFAGEISPVFSLAGDSEKDLYDHFKNSLINEKTNFFFDEKKGQFHLYYLIGKGPILAWGELSEVSVLQKSLIQALFNALNSNLEIQGKK